MGRNARWGAGKASHPVELNSGSQDCKTSHCEVLLPRISARLQAVPCVILVQWFSPERSLSYPVLVGFEKAETTSTSRNVRRTFHVPSGVPVQRSLSERDVSHPVVELEKAETTSTSQNSRTTASSPLRYSGPVIRF